MGEIRQVRRETLPLPVGAPFGVDMDLVELIGALAPRHHRTQQVLALAQLAASQASREACTDPVGIQLNIARVGQGGQLFQRAMPGLEVGVTLAVQAIGQLLGQGAQPAGEAVADGAWFTGKLGEGAVKVAVVRGNAHALGRVRAGVAVIRRL